MDMPFNQAIPYEEAFVEEEDTAVEGVFFSEDDVCTVEDNTTDSQKDTEADESTESDEKTDADESADTALELCELREKVRELNERLLAQAEESRRISEQLGEFFDVFPNTDLKTLPDSVWDSVRAGNSLAASYALYRQRVYQREMAAKTVNERNAGSSSGRVGTNSSKEYFSPDEVRSMSRSEVKANYSKIIESMKKWN
ncbi:MAG: hypothetical protein E7677_04595 [Ruminococcaceae bacterium]|nr:hypothetical protein [Oscillospiraceae bacterium]